MMPSFGIYVGPGSSHSWIWWVDFLESHGYFRIEFFSDGIPDKDFIIIGGGDTYSIASHLGKSGAHQLISRIERGSNYIGSCAGAYLGLRSSLDPLRDFNLLDAKISNISSRIQLDPRYLTPHGCQLVFQPLRGGLEILSFRGRIRAPLYGGPCMILREGMSLGYYWGIPEDVEYIVDPDLARRVVLGKVAIAYKRLGRGAILLLGPHLEHPQYRDSNEFLDYLIRSISKCHGFPRNSRSNLHQAHSSAREFRRIISSIKIRLSGMQSMHWRLGYKYWDPEALLVMIQGIWRRSSGLQELDPELMELGSKLDLVLKHLPKNQELGAQATQLTNQLCVKFLSKYFERKSEMS